MDTINIGLVQSCVISNQLDQTEKCANHPGKIIITSFDSNDLGKMSHIWICFHFLRMFFFCRSLDRAWMR